MTKCDIRGWGQFYPKCLCDRTMCTVCVLNSLHIIKYATPQIHKIISIENPLLHCLLRYLWLNLRHNSGRGDKKSVADILEFAKVAESAGLGKDDESSAGSTYISWTRTF